ncbi:MULTISPECIES: peptidase inhibitor family I36 protein [unclassified Streptomyces]|uniref:peptidase inhibitor family I36 protein n=1 Tax=unclassified Streptomyces TaxID=2593676 RepID=UPI001F51C963|nr:peptidase inhibitor family I36 protein [Streptomyces sp. CB01883]
MRILRPRRLRTSVSTLLAAVVPTILATSLAGLAPAHATAPAVRDQIACPRGFVCTHPEINFNGQPYIKRAVDGSVRHLPDYIRGKGSSVVNNSSRTAPRLPEGQLPRPARLRRPRRRHHQRVALLPAQRHHPQPPQQRHPLRRLTGVPEQDAPTPAPEPAAAPRSRTAVSGSRRTDRGPGTRLVIRVQRKEGPRSGASVVQAPRPDRGRARHCGPARWRRAARHRARARSVA